MQYPTNQDINRAINIQRRSPSDGDLSTSSNNSANDGVSMLRRLRRMKRRLLLEHVANDASMTYSKDYSPPDGSHGSNKMMQCHFKWNRYWIINEPCRPSEMEVFKIGKFLPLRRTREGGNLKFLSYNALIQTCGARCIFFAVHHDRFDHNKEHVPLPAIWIHKF